MVNLSKITLIMVLALGGMRDNLRANDCNQWFLPVAKQSQIVNDRFWYFIETLLQQQAINLTNLERMLAGLNQGQWLNLYSPEETAINSTKLVYYQTAAEYLKSGQLDGQLLKNRLLAKIFELKQVQSNRQQTAQQTATVFRPLQFNEVGVPGEFLMGGTDNRQKPMKLTHAVAFSDTHLTQNQFFELTQNNPAVYKNGDNADDALDIMGISQRPDHPVENINWYSAAWVCNLLSKKYGYPEVYDFSRFEADPTSSALKGNLKPVNGGSDIITINGPNIYETSGIRLATEAELEWLQKAGGQLRDYSWGNNVEAALDYGWFKGNALSQTHKVASKEPVYIRGQAFYDLSGNVFSWANDGLAHYRAEYTESVNPVGQPNAWLRAIRGGCFSLRHHEIKINARYNYQAEKPAVNIGFRVVKTLK